MTLAKRLRSGPISDSSFITAVTPSPWMRVRSTPAQLASALAQHRIRRAACCLRAAACPDRPGMLAQFAQQRLQLGVALGQMLARCRRTSPAPGAARTGARRASCRVSALAISLGAGLDAAVRWRASTFGSRSPATMARMIAWPVAPITSLSTSVELDVHLHQRLLHALHPTGLLGQQHLALARHRAHHAHLAVRAPRRAQQPQAHELLQPLAVLHVALAPGHVLHLPRIDQPDLQAALLQHLVHRDPVHARRLQRHRVHAARDQPVGQRVQVVGHRAELAHRLLGRVPAAPPPSGSMRPHRSPPHWETPRLLACALPWLAPPSLMNGSAMGIVEIDSISQTGCASLRSPLSPTIPGPCSVSGLATRR